MDRAAFQSLYETYASLVYQRCRALLGNAAEAEEMTQEVFVRAFRRMPDALGAHKLPWLYATAGNLCRDRARRRRHELRFQSSGTPEAVPDARAAVEGRSVLRWVLSQVDALTARMGVLHFLDGFTQEEIGERTGYSRKTVAKKLHTFETLCAAAQRSEP